MSSITESGEILPYEILDEAGNTIAAFYSRNDMLHCLVLIQSRHSRKRFHTINTFYHDYDYESDSPEVSN